LFFLLIVVLLWQESSKVTEMRERIKRFLASQGMLRGIGSGSQNLSQKPAVLQLQEYSSGSGSTGAEDSPHDESDMCNKDQPQHGMYISFNPWYS